MATLNGISGGGWQAITPTMLGTGSSTYAFTYQTEGQSAGSIRLEAGVTVDSHGVKNIHPRLYFSYVKSKLTKIEKAKLTPQLTKLQAMVREAKEMNQQALYEVLSEKIVSIVKEAELVAAGFQVYVLQEHIEKFRSVAFTGDRSGKVDFIDYQDYPRLMPRKIGRQIKLLIKKGLYDNFKVLSLTYDTKKIKTNKEKIREKDPILFGTTAVHKDRLYYIADWVDEHCDLTLEKFMEKVPTVGLNLRPIDHSFIDKLKAEVRARGDRLQQTRPDNYRGLMAIEEHSKLGWVQRLVRRPWWKR